MEFKTPFFSAFGPRMFGRRAQRKLPVPEEDIGQLRSVFGKHLPKGALARAKSAANSRQRLFGVEATFLPDPKEYPAGVLAELYGARWNIELRCREIKTNMSAEVLRRRSPKMIEKELCKNAIAYNLMRCVMREAAQRHDVPLDRLSFKGSMDTVRHFAGKIHAASGKPRSERRHYDELLVIIASDPLPYRPERNEPRARKRRPKPCQLLNQPRHKMRVIPHRNRYRATDNEGLS